MNKKLKLGKSFLIGLAIGIVIGLIVLKAILDKM